MLQLLCSNSSTELLLLDQHKYIATSCSPSLNGNILPSVFPTLAICLLILWYVKSVWTHHCWSFVEGVMLNIIERIFL